MSEQRLIQIFKALSIGIFLDLLATLAAGMLLGLFFAVIFLIQGIPDEEVAARVQAMAMSRGWLIFSVLVGALISLAAGFVTANFLRFNIYPWLGLMGALLTVIGYVGVGPDMDPALAMGLSLLTLCSVMLGGRLWLWVQQ